MPETETGQTTRLIAKVLRDVLAAETFTSRTDLDDVLKRRLARLHIRATPNEIHDAERLIETNRALTTPAAAAAVALPQDTPPISRAAAATILAAIRQRLHRPISIRRMPAARVVTQREADRARAVDLVLHEIERTAARCDALEAAGAREGDWVTTRRTC